MISPPLRLSTETPLLESAALGCWLKMEALQPSGSFKLRGIGHACATPHVPRPAATPASPRPMRDGAWACRCWWSCPRPRARRHPIIPHVVSDRAAVEACLRFMDDHRVVVEPACGAALAALGDYERVLVIVCGGVTATVEQLQRWGQNLPA